ncbi:hypothetical protein GOP47_0011601 [Adiantum capillus-veneris]|uniref:Hexosyltransferase n=1 Tax=Adiantum capillus-veneris TaxID=13818 RepID=A0A9D4UT35_ADICA|nr:hypothetical protein GOP47_0011601 [Adiantum capillus-veneris]
MRRVHILLPTAIPFFLLLGALFSVHAFARAPAGDRKIYFGSSSRPRTQQTSQAYVTLLYGDEFALGVRVLGKSLRDTGTTRDMVALVSQGVSDLIIHVLQADGWIIERIELLANPNSKRPKRFWGVYTKLKIFNMTNYKKVVYLDADTVVTKSIDDLFLCEKFCANLKHSERLNSGVMVLEPSKELYDDMMTKVKTLPSYTGGDQGFLNSYYSDFPNAHLFNPDLSEEERRSRPPPAMERLSTLYNADVGLYMLANKWMVDEAELRVIHYTLGPLKPWDWWTFWLLEPVRFWQDVRVTLEDSLPGTGGGQDPHTQLFVWVLIAGPLLVLLFLCRHCFFQVQQSFLSNSSLFGFTRHIVHKPRGSSSLPYFSAMNGSPPQASLSQYTNGSTGSNSNLLKVPSCLGSLSIGACFLCAGVSFGVAMFLIPRQVTPLTGLFLVYEWTFFLFALLYGWFLEAMSMWGRSLGSSMTGTLVLHYDSGKGNSKHASSFDGHIVLYCIGVACLAVLVPCLPFFFGVTALFSRLGMVIGGAMLLVIAMTNMSEHLAVCWFLRGRESGSQARGISESDRL